MRNKKAFTLVELMAVIVILAIILALVIPKIFRSVKESKIRVCNIQMNNIKDAAASYFAKNRYKEVFEGVGTTYDEESKKTEGVDIYLDDLYNSSLLKGKITNPVNDSELKRTSTVVNVKNNDDAFEYKILIYDSSADSWEEVVCE